MSKFSRIYMPNIVCGRGSLSFAAGSLFLSPAALPNGGGWAIIGAESLPAEEGTL